MSESLVTVEYVTACPRCGSGRLVSPIGLTERLEFCMECRAVWEGIPAGEFYRRDGELMAFRSPCDNCAFRKGSPESADRAGWRNLIEQLRHGPGGMFYCHKGVPFDPVHQPGTGFLFPKRPDGGYDQSQMRLCRGFLNAWGRWIKYPRRTARRHYCSIDESGAT